MPANAHIWNSVFDCPLPWILLGRRAMQETPCEAYTSTNDSTALLLALYTVGTSLRAMFDEQHTTRFTQGSQYAASSTFWVPQVFIFQALTG